MYFLSASTFRHAGVSSEETSIWRISTGEFLRDKRKATRQRYENMVSAASMGIKPVFQVHADHEWPLNILSIAFRYVVGSNSSCAIALRVLFCIILL